jgi:hypothetical protein
MKTLLLATAILLVTVTGINQSAYAANKDNVQAVLLTEINKVNKIEVYGNVELYLSNGFTDNVKVYNQYYKESALVQDQNGVLRISSYKAEKLVVWVTVNNLSALSVHDNAEVRSFGKLSAIDLDVKLYNNASAQLDMDAYNANITLSDQAKANLSGNIEYGEIKYDRSSSLNTFNLISAHVGKKVNASGDSAELNLSSL